MPFPTGRWRTSAPGIRCATAVSCNGHGHRLSAAATRARDALVISWHGVASPPALNTALRAVLPADTGAADAVPSAASHLGSSNGAALLYTIAAAAAASYLAAQPAASAAAARSTDSPST